MNIFVIVKVNHEYCNYLRVFDDKVYFNDKSKDSRPYIGVLFDIENIKYFAPLSSPKAKHLSMKSSMDFIKIDNGRLGVINLNNMIPVLKNCYEIIDLNKKGMDEKETKYYMLFRDQYFWLNSHFIQIKKKSLKLYQMYINDKLPLNIKKDVAIINC